MSKKIDLTNKRFGHLLVLYEVPERKNGKIYWHCKCDCGKEIDVYGSSLRSGNTKSCGCMKHHGLIDYNLKASEEAKIPLGSIFGFLEVVEDLGLKSYYNTGHQRRYYLCKCLKCGSQKEYNQNELKNGRISCGCIGSKGEEKIREILKNNNIIFEYNKGLPHIERDSGYKLRFDFIIYNQDKTINRCVEFDGEQHRIGMKGGIWSHCDSLEVIQERDQAKNLYCINKDIPLVRIPYSRLSRLCLEDILSNKYVINERG